VWWSGISTVRWCMAMCSRGQRLGYCNLLRMVIAVIMDDIPCQGLSDYYKVDNSQPRGGAAEDNYLVNYCVPSCCHQF
jgi:hypothetical protein